VEQSAFTTSQDVQEQNMNNVEWCKECMAFIGEHECDNCATCGTDQNIDAQGFDEGGHFVPEVIAERLGV
jgi:hypothetical protein